MRLIKTFSFFKNMNVLEDYEVKETEYKIT